MLPVTHRRLLEIFNEYPSEGEEGHSPAGNVVRELAGTIGVLLYTLQDVLTEWGGGRNAEQGISEVVANPVFRETLQLIRDLGYSLPIDDTFRTTRKVN